MFFLTHLCFVYREYGCRLNSQLQLLNVSKISNTFVFREWNYRIEAKTIKIFQLQKQTNQPTTEMCLLIQRAHFCSAFFFCLCMCTQNTEWRRSRHYNSRIQRVLKGRNSAIIIKKPQNVHLIVHKTLQVSGKVVGTEKKLEWSTTFQEF